MNQKVPILIIAFNRLDCVRQVFESVRKYQPSELYMAADGPRPNREGEADKCKEVRTWLTSHVDWPCNVHTRFLDENVGCGQGPKQAIDWFFSNEEMGVILEDDCVADETFFPYCEQMLERYKEDTHISIVCGSNFDKNGECILPDSDYFFSVVPYTWGWATWRRNWLDYDYQMSGWLEGGQNRLLRYISDDVEHRNYWRYVFDRTAGNAPHDIWDYQFFYSCYRKRQMAIVPNRNLISNIGVGADATHSFGRAEDRMALQRYSLCFPLQHPVRLERNRKYDHFVLDCCYGRSKSISIFTRIKRKIKLWIYNLNCYE